MGTEIAAADTDGVEMVTVTEDSSSNKNHAGMTQRSKSKHTDVNSENEGASRKKFAVSTRWEREVSGLNDESVPPIPPPKCNLLNKICCTCAKPLGGMFVLYERERDGQPYVIAGPLWGFCAFVTVPLIVFISGVFYYFVLLNDKINLPFWIQIVYACLIGLTLLFLAFTSCRNPGLIERVTDEEAGRGGWYWNEQCGTYRPPSAMYCRECKVRNMTPIEFNFR